jgi:thiamine monophosphate synthase
MTPPRLLAITPPSGVVDAGAVESWIEAGARSRGLAVLLRTPDAALAELVAPAGRLAALTRACRERGIPTLLSVGSNMLAEAAELIVRHGHAGAQVRGDPTLAQLSRARARLGERVMLGRSCHGAPRPGHELVEYTCFAPVFTPTTSQEGVHKRAAGLAALRRWTAAPGAHVLALGGVGPLTAARCVEAGARGLAGIGAFFGDRVEVVENVAALCRALATDDAHRPPARDVLFEG